MPVRHRILCLVLQPQNARAEKQSRAALCEAFLRFSPRVQMKPPYSLFIDIGPTSALIGGEELIIRQASELAQTFGFSVKAAISDTPSVAHALAQSLSLACSSESHHISPRGAEKETLQRLSLPLLLHFHGVEVAAHPVVVQQMVSFFYMLGFRTLGDVASFSEAAFRERWGETGIVIRNQLNGENSESISPFVALQPAQESVYLDFPITVVSLLYHEVRKASELLFARLQGRRLLAQSLVIRLRCEDSSVRYNIMIEPRQASRDLGVFLSLLDEQLDSLDLDNAIRDFDIEVATCAESVRQLGFSETVEPTNERLQTLLSVLNQCGKAATPFQVERQAPVQQAQQQQPQTMRTPKRLLRQPRAITPTQIKKLHFLARHPLAQIESEWWHDEHIRVYYLAVDDRGKSLWIYRDLETHGYFLHGHFD